MSVALAFGPEIVEAINRTPAEEISGQDVGSERQHYEKPDYEAWDQINEFRLFQAACLWAECEPPREWRIMPRPAFVRQQMLQEAVKNTEIKYFKQRPGGVGGDMEQVEEIAAADLISRGLLTKYAEKTNQRPKFLFPEVRGS